MKVAVIGGGIVGAEILRNASPGLNEITLIEPKRQIECQALFPELLAGTIEIEDVTAPLKPFCDPDEFESSLVFVIRSLR